MRCPRCASEVGKAQIICDGCGVLLMEERSKSTTTSSPVDLQPKNIIEERPVNPEPAVEGASDLADVTSSQVQIDKETPPSAFSPQATEEPNNVSQPSAFAESTAFTADRTDPIPEPEAVTPKVDDTALATPAETPAIEQEHETITESTSEKESSEPPSLESDATILEPPEDKPQKPSLMESPILLWILTLMILTMPLALLLCWKSTWAFKRKLLFTIVSLLIGGLALIITFVALLAS